MTGGPLRDTGAASVGYIGGTTGGTLRDTGAESVGYIGGRGGEGEGGSGCNLNYNNPTLMTPR